MTALARSLAFESGDQFAYPTYGDVLDHEHGAAVVGWKHFDPIKAPTQPRPTMGMGSVRLERFAYVRAHAPGDELFPAGTKAPDIIDLLVFGRVGETEDQASIVEKELMNYKRYPDDWDGCGARAPTSEVVDCAIHVLRNLPGDFPRPEASLTSDGTIALDLLDEGFRSVCTIEVVSASRAVYSVSTPEGVIADAFNFGGDSMMLAALGRISQSLS